MLRHLIHILLLCLPGLITAQALRIEYFTVNDGLSTRDINSLYIGDDGFLWVSTMDGLNRFDGQSFRRFGEDPKSATGLSRGAINAVKEDNEDKFIVTFRDFFGYFDRFDPRNFSVEQVRLSPSTGILGYPRAIVTDDLGRTFVVSIGSEGTFLYEYTPNGDDERRNFTPIYHEPTDAWTTLAPQVELLPLSSGQFLLYDEFHGLRHLSPTGDSLSTPLAEITTESAFYTFAEAADGSVFLSFKNDETPVFRWTPKTGKAVALGKDIIDAGLVYPKVFKDQKGQLMFLGTEDILGSQFPADYYLVDSNGVFSLFEEAMPTGRAVIDLAAIDFQETVYLALREGVGVIERYVNPVETYLTVADDDQLFRNSLRGIAEGQSGRVYFTEEEGVLYYLDPGSTTPDTLFLTDIADSTRSIRYRAGRELVYDQERNALWGTAQPTGLGKTSGLLFRYDITSGLTEKYLSGYPLEALVISPEGAIFLAGTDPRKIGILLKFDPEKKRFSTVMETGEPEKEVAGIRINCLQFSRNKELLIGTQNRGLMAFVPDTRSLKYYNISSQESGPPELDTRPIFVIHEDDEGDWWLGTESGLLHYKRTTSKTVRYGRGEGLSSNIVYGIVPDKEGGFWLSTQNGLVRIPTDFAAGSFRRYYREDGLSNDEFNPYSFHRSEDGRYFFGGKNGITVFREEDLSAENAGAEVMLTEVNVYGRTGARTITRNLDQLNEVTLSASEKSVAISFALPAGQRPGSSQFRYRLEGFNDDWVDLTNERAVRFNNLESGKYQLRIQGAGANGNYGEQEMQLQLKIEQYIFEKLWFQGLTGAVVTGLILLILQAKLREKLRNEQLRTQLSSDIHDEVSGLLAGITLQAELLKSYTDDKKLQSRLHTVGEAGRSAMSKMSDVIWSIDSRRDTLGDLLQRMQEHADEVLLPLEIRYDFKATGFDETKSLPGNIRQDIYFIFKEAINNIAAHSNASRVDIRVEQLPQTFDLFIKDNGTKIEDGTDPSSPNSLRTSVRARKTGQGKDNMRMRASRLKGDLEMKEENGYMLQFTMRRL
ncbi:MAG: signal transduction histidine kinase [Neolewinella sp.]